MSTVKHTHHSKTPKNAGLKSHMHPYIPPLLKRKSPHEMQQDKPSTAISTASKGIPLVISSCKKRKANANAAWLVLLLQVFYCNDRHDRNDRNEQHARIAEYYYQLQGTINDCCASKRRGTTQPTGDEVGPSDSFTPTGTASPFLPRERPVHFVLQLQAHFHNFQHY